MKLCVLLFKKIRKGVLTAGWEVGVVLQYHCCISDFFNRVLFLFAIYQKPKNNLYDILFLYANRLRAIGTYNHVRPKPLLLILPKERQYTLKCLRHIRFKVIHFKVAHFRNDKHFFICCTLLFLHIWQITPSNCSAFLQIPDHRDLLSRCDQGQAQRSSAYLRW